MSSGWSGLNPWTVTAELSIHYGLIWTHGNASSPANSNTMNWASAEISALARHLCKSRHILLRCARLSTLSSALAGTCQQLANSIARCRPYLCWIKPFSLHCASTAYFATAPNTLCWQSMLKSCTHIYTYTQIVLVFCAHQMCFLIEDNFILVAVVWNIICSDCIFSNTVYVHI